MNTNSLNISSSDSISLTLFFMVFFAFVFLCINIMFYVKLWNMTNDVGKIKDILADSIIGRGQN